MIKTGQRVGDARIWTAPGERRSIAEVVAARRSLFLFYLFDWSST